MPQINKSNQLDFWERSPNGIETGTNEPNCITDDKHNQTEGGGRKKRT